MVIIQSKCDLCQEMLLTNDIFNLLWDLGAPHDGAPRHMAAILASMIPFIPPPRRSSKDNHTHTEIPTLLQQQHGPWRQCWHNIQKQAVKIIPSMTTLMTALVFMNFQMTAATWTWQTFSQIQMRIQSKKSTLGTKVVKLFPCIVNSRYRKMTKTWMISDLPTVSIVTIRTKKWRRSEDTNTTDCTAGGDTLVTNVNEQESSYVMLVSTNRWLNYLFSLAVSRSNALCFFFTPIMTNKYRSPVS